MKTLNDILTLGTFLCLVFTGPFAHAEKMNMETQDLVIKKLERVLSAMEKTEAPWLSSQQRLADLLAERARTRFMLEVEANCDGCKGSKEDRLKAVKIYESLLAEVKINEHGPILFQLAHLYEMSGQVDKAINLYESIIKDAKKKKILPAIVSRSHVGLGDLLFQKGRFKEAKEHYLIALKDSNLENRSLTVYNLAWCEFNSDNLTGGITTLENLLKNPSKITRDTDEGSRYDAAFHTDILRDLATFYTKKDISTRDIDTYEALIPNEKRKILMLSFAKEADRIGQKKSAHEILNRYISYKDITTEERINASVMLAQINYDRGQTSESIAEFAKAAMALQKGGCKDSGQCEEFQKTMKRYVTELHRSKKLKPDQDLLNAYLTYGKTFPLDTEMNQRGAQVALDLGNYPVAVALYRSVSESSSFSEKDREAALAQEISAAEKSKNPELQKQAYLHYLKYGKNQEKAYQVQYQLAYLSYTQKQFATAAEAFEDLAKNKNGSQELRKKAADLSLDCLVETKNENTLEALAWDYVEIFPNHKLEFETIARKALMNRVARVANDPKSSISDLEKALKSLNSQKVSSANSAEKILFYSNQSVLAQKLQEDEVYVEALNNLIALSAQNKQKQQAYLEQLTGYYEKHLDFKNAYNTALRIENPQISDKERELRLGTLADLAGLDASTHYRKSLQNGLSGERSLVLRARLVLISGSPHKELKTQAREIKQNPSLLNETALLVYAKAGPSNELNSVLAMKELQNKSAPLFIRKQSFYQKVQAEKAVLQEHDLETKSDRLLQKSIEARVKLLNKADKILAESLNLKDVTAQLLALNLVSSENERMVKNLASLPLPEGLSPQEKSQYLSILKMKSKPYLLKARYAQQKQQEIWNRSAGLLQTFKDYKTARIELKTLLGKELKILQQLPGKGPMKDALEKTLDEPSFSTRDLSSARKSVAKNPTNRAQIENLKLIETKIGHPLMPSYLEARLSHLQRGKSL